MHEILCSSSSVSSTNIIGVREGVGLPEVRRLINYQRDWDQEYLYPWNAIRKEWFLYWDTSRPWLLDKSPPNLVRARAIEECFDPAWFIVMTRDPYASAEGMMRRNGMDLAEASEFVIRCLKWQRQNLTFLERKCLVRYEDLVQMPAQVRERIMQFLPGLAPISVGGRFSAHNQLHKPMEITNFNMESIRHLTVEQVRLLSQRFAEDQEVLRYFGYEPRQPPQ